MTTIEILEALRAHFGEVSDYKVHKLAGIAQQTVSHWRNGHVMSDAWAVKCADILGLPRAYLLACVNAERAKDQSDTSGVWRQIADVFRDKVALWLAVSLLGFAVFSASQPASAADFSAINNIHYTKYCGRAAKRRRRTPRRRRTLYGKALTAQQLRRASLCTS